MQAVRVADKYWNILEGPMKKLEAEAESKSSSFCSVYAWQRLEPSVTARIRVACGLEICVESTANLRYTAGRDGQGPQHNLQSDILSRFSTCLPSGALVVYSFSGPRRFFAGPGTRPYRSGEPMYYAGDISRLRETLGTLPDTSFQAGIRQTLDLML